MRLMKACRRRDRLSSSRDCLISNLKCFISGSVPILTVMYRAKLMFLIFLMIHILNTMCDKNKRSETKKLFDNLNSIYAGEKFPSKYLIPDATVPTKSDLLDYIDAMMEIFDYFLINPNKTDCNVGLGIYLSKVILKKTLIENGNKLNKTEHNAITMLIQAADYYLSHYIVVNKQYGWDDAEYRISTLYVDDKPHVYSIRNFNKHKLMKWLISNSKINGFEESMDDLSLPKEKYIELVDSMNQYFIAIHESDKCLSRIVFNPEPINLDKLQPCRRDEFCMQRMFTSPSVSYSLSHRLMNILLYRNTRRCYWKSEEEDDEHMDFLCSFMYRETVYIARKGFFSRDLFLEHIALCSLLGYEEFNRHSWFKKAMSWINEDGCIKEFANFDLNRTNIMVQNAGDNIEQIKKIKRFHRKLIYNECHDHPTALLLIVQSHAVRHALHVING